MRPVSEPLKNPEVTFRSTLTLWDAVALVVSGMVGSGIFVVSSQVAIDLQSGLLVLGAWVFTAIMSYFGALAFGELACLWPQVGGQYVFIRNLWGRLPSFLYGWTLSLIIKSATIAAVALASIRFISSLPVLFPSIPGLAFLPPSVSVILYSKLAAVALIIGLTWLNLFDVKCVARIQNVLTFINIGSLVLIIGMAFWFAFNSHQTLHWENISLHSLFSKSSVLNQPHVFTLLGCALIGPLFAFDGWGNVTVLASEVQNPKRNIPIALLLGVGLIGLLYALVNLSYLLVLPFPQIIASRDGILAASFIKVVWGPFAQTLLLIMMLIAAIGCLNNMILSGSRAIYALAKDDFLPSRFSDLSQRNKVPTNALCLQAAWSSLLVIGSAFNQLLGYMVFAVVFFSLITVLGLIVYRQKNRTTSLFQTFKTEFYCVVFSLFSVWVLFSLFVENPMTILVNFAVSVSGLLVYWWMGKKTLNSYDQSINDSKQGV